jgi:D-serine deaminase-like pyridoxal phosphate-dependent protein
MGATRALRAGMPVEELETPILTIDLDVMERNLARMMAILGDSGVRLRPHLKTAKSPALAHLMLQAGAVGICCAKLAEAEVMANAGVTDILLTSEVAGVGKHARLVELAARLPGFKAVVDNPDSVAEIAALARARGVTAKLLIELDVHTHRSGVQTPDATLTLADTIRAIDGVELVGIHAYAGHAQVRPLAERQERNAAAMALLRETVDLLREHNHEVAQLTGGGTGTAQLDAELGLLTEVQAGSFLLMDTNYRDAGVPFENALRCRSTIISRPTPERAVCDAGGKTLSSDGGPAELQDRPGVRYLRGSDEHGSIGVDPNLQQAPLSVGDVVTLLPSHICTTINLHDVMVGVRNGAVEAIYPIEARGHIW